MYVKQESSYEEREDKMAQGQEQTWDLVLPPVDEPKVGPLPVHLVELVPVLRHLRSQHGAGDRPEPGRQQDACSQWQPPTHKCRRSATATKLNRCHNSQPIWKTWQPHIAARHTVDHTVRRLGELERDASEVGGADEAPGERELPRLPQGLELRKPHLWSEETTRRKGEGRGGERRPGARRRGRRRWTRRRRRRSTWGGARRGRRPSWSSRGRRGCSPSAASSPRSAHRSPSPPPPPVRWSLGFVSTARRWCCPFAAVGLGKEGRRKTPLSQVTSGPGWTGLEWSSYMGWAQLENARASATAAFFVPISIFLLSF